MEEQDHERCMMLALEQAEKALLEGEVPVGCVFVGPSGAIVAEGRNMTNVQHNATRHAGMSALRCNEPWLVLAFLLRFVCIRARRL